MYPVAAADSLALASKLETLETLETRFDARIEYQ